MGPCLSTKEQTSKIPRVNSKIETKRTFKREATRLISKREFMLSLNQIQ